MYSIFRENSHGISKIKSFATYSMTFNLDSIHFLPHNKSWKLFWYFEIQTVLNFLYDFFGSTNQLHSLRFQITLFILWGADVGFFFNLDISFPTKKLWKSLWNFKIQIICNVVLSIPELHVPINVILVLR